MEDFLRLKNMTKDTAVGQQINEIWSMLDEMSKKDPKVN